ncbi:MAG: hypothetical protein U0941_11050 [Planctomycetaceae bacterium]
MFDPYRKWLGIPPKDQPPNHYRLLGLENFEDDLDVVEGAAERQMGFVRQYQSGEYAADAARILNELATARLCLLKPATKAAYDAKLRAQFAAAEPDPSLDFADLPLADEGVATEPSRRKPKKKSSKSKSFNPSTQMIAGAAGAVICFLLLVFVLSGRRPQPVEKPQDAGSIATSSDKVASEKSPPVSLPSGTDPAKSVLWSDSKLVTEPAGASIDLLKLVDLSRDVLTGEWQQTNTALIGPAGGRIYFPAKTPEDYQLKFSVRRIEGNDTLGLGFMMAGRQGMVVLDELHSTSSGMPVDGRAAEDDLNCTKWRGKLFEDKTLGQIVITVHPGHLHLTFGGKTIIDWHGDPQRLFLHDAYGIASRQSPFALVSKSSYAFESATLTPIKPEPPQLRAKRPDRDVDVIPMIDSDRDAVRGVWAIGKNSLTSPEGWGKIYLPTVVPEEYSVSATIELPADSNGDYAFAFGLLAGNSYFQWASNRDSSGLDTIDGRRWDNNETSLRGPILKPGIPVQIACTVSRSSIRIDADGKTLIDWRGDVKRLSIPGEWALPDGRQLFLGTNHHLKIRNLKLGPPLPAPKNPAHPPFSIGKPVDLLALIDPARDALSGKWVREGTALRCLGDLEYNKLAIPIDPPDEYKLTVRVAKIEGGQKNNESLFVRLPIGPYKANLAIDGYGSTASGIHIDQTIYRDNSFAYRGPPVIPAGATREIVIIQKKDGLNVSCEGTSIIDWKGNPRRYSFDTAWVIPGNRLALTSWFQGFRFEKLELEPLPPTSIPSAPSLGADGKILPIINVDRDTRYGEWKVEGDALTCNTRASSRLNIPAKVPKSYILSGSVERIGGVRQLNIGLLVDGHPCAIVIDADIMQNAGIDLLDGKRYFDGVNLVHRSYKAPLLPQNQRVPLRCVVSPDTILVTCGDKEIIRWHGDPRRLSLLNDLVPPNYSEDDWKHLFLGSWESAFAFRDLELKPLTDTEADELSKSFSGVFPTTPQKDVPLATSAATSSPAIGSTPTSPGSTSSGGEPWLLKRKPNALALLLIGGGLEQESAIEACRQTRLPYHMLPDFPAPGFDYSRFSLIAVGSNVMDYWVAPERKNAAAFQPLADFVKAGGHLLVFNAYNGRNMEHLQQFGIRTGFNHTTTFEMIPGVSEIVFDGVMDRIPTSKYLQQAGDFIVDKPHVVLLRRGPGLVEGGPTVATLKHGTGRVTYSSVEPWYGEPKGFWLVHALVHWAGRGAPVVKQDLDTALAVDPNSGDDQPGKLEIQEVKYGPVDRPATITPAALAAAKSGLFVVIADNSLIGGDSKPGAPKYLSLKYRMNGIEAYRVIAEGQTAVLDARATMNLAPDDPFKLVEVRYGVGIYNPAKWTDVTQRFRPLVKKNGLNLAKEECDKALSGLPGHAANVPKSLVVHYQYRGRDSFAAFGPGSAVTIGDLVEKK